MRIHLKLGIAQIISLTAVALTLLSCREAELNLPTEIDETSAELSPPTEFDNASMEAAQKRDEDGRPNVIVVFTDDQGYADLSAQGVLGDIVTPHIDQLAADGTRFTSGYATAPQCTPSRAGLITGKYQQRFGLDDNRFTPMPLEETTLANRLQEDGYSTGMVGKWHLEIDQNSQDYDTTNLTVADRIPFFPDQRGFDDVYFGYRDTWWTNYDLEGNTLPAEYRSNKNYRLDVATDASLAFIERHKQDPFFLYLAYYAPHVPLEATEKYLSRFPDVPETRRQHGLAMMSAIDDGIGRLREKLDMEQLSDNTLIFYISDNGAPLGIRKLDLPVSNHGGAWDGSLNDPMVGEKGMLSEGGIRVPYIVSWPGAIPAGIVSDTPVTTLDVAATALAAAGIDIPTQLDGANLIAELTGETVLEERSLFWRFWSQSAVRKGSWKYLKAGSDGEYLFDMNSSAPETVNLLADYPAIADELRKDLSTWADELQRPGIPDSVLDNQEKNWFEHYFP